MRISDWSSDVCSSDLIVVCHLGLTTGGSIGAETALKLEDCPAKVDAWAAAALKVKPDILVLVHGGPVSMPDDAAYVLNNTETCHGFYGASSMERLPTAVARSEEHTSELQSLMRIPYAVFCWKK